MNRYVLALLISHLITSCLGMDLKKIADLQHQVPILRTVKNQHKNIIFFLTQKQSLDIKKKRSLEIYDANTEKIIKSIDIEEYNCPIINLKRSHLLAIRHRSSTTLYNLKNDTEKKFEGNSLDQLSFVSDENKLFTIKGNQFMLYDVDNGKICDIPIEGTTTWSYTISNDKKHIIFASHTNKNHEYFCNGIYHYTIKNNSLKKLSTQKDNSSSYEYRYVLNDASNFLVFFEPQEKKLKLYDLTAHTIVEPAFKCTTIPDSYVFINDTTILLTFGTWYYVWDIKEETFNLILALEAEGYRAKISPQKKFITFYHVAGFDYFAVSDDCRFDGFLSSGKQSFGKEKQIIYNSEQNKLIELATEEYDDNTTYGRFDYNKNERYLMQIWKGSLNHFIRIYDTNSGKIHKTLHAQCQKHCYVDGFQSFTPCGKFAVIGWYNKILTIYDIENDKTAFESTFKRYSDPQFYKYSLIIFASDEKTLVVYDYILDKKIELKTQEQITHFSIAGDFLTLSYGQQTELYDLSDESNMHKRLYTFNDYDCNFIYKQ